MTSRNRKTFADWTDFTVGSLFDFVIFFNYVNKYDLDGASPSFMAYFNIGFILMVQIFLREKKFSI